MSELLDKRFDTVSVACDELCPEWEVETPERFARGDLVLNPRTGETVLVLRRWSDRLTVKRGINGKPEPIRAGDDILHIGVSE